jgi:hypothetical protein
MMILMIIWFVLKNSKMGDETAIYLMDINKNHNKKSKKWIPSFILNFRLGEIRNLV